MSRRAGSAVALGLFGLMGLGSNCERENCAADASYDPTISRLLLTRLGRTEGITSMVVMSPGERVPFSTDPGVTLVANRGEVDQTPGQTSGTYTAPLSGRDEIRLLYAGAYGVEDRGWVGVRVEGPSDARWPPVCSEIARGSTPVGGSTTVHRRHITADHLGAGSTCSSSVVEVPIHHLPLGARMPLTLPPRYGILPNDRERGEVVAELTLTPEGATIDARSVGRRAVEFVQFGPNSETPCRGMILVEVEHEACADGGVDGGVSDRPDVEVDVQDVQDVQNVRDVQDVQNVRDVPDVQDVRDVQDVQDVRDVQDVQDVQVVPDVEVPTPSVFAFGDVLPIGLVAFDGGLFWYDNADHGLHRFDLTTLSDRVVLAETSVLLRDIVAADGRLFWTTGPSGPSQVVAWRPGDAAPSAPLLTASRAFDSLTGDGTRLYAHEPDALRWARYDGTGVGAATSSSGQRGFAVAGGRIYFADLGLFGSTRGVFRVPTTPDPTTLLASRDSVLAGTLLDDDAAVPLSIVVDGAVFGLGLDRLLRARVDGTGTPTELARLGEAGANWTRMCLARDRVYMVDQFQSRLWSVPANGVGGVILMVAAPGSGGVGFSLACTADSVWWWSGPRLNRYRLP